VGPHVLGRVEVRGELPPGSWRTPLCGLVGRSVLAVDRRLHATGTMASSIIIEVDGPFNNYLLRFFSSPEMMAGEHFVLQGGEERLGCGIVETRSGPGPLTVQCRVGRRGW
jgi:hypothetical protein